LNSRVSRIRKALPSTSNTLVPCSSVTVKSSPKANIFWRITKRVPIRCSGPGSAAGPPRRLRKSMGVLLSSSGRRR
jgi:hypothetical protein